MTARIARLFVLGLLAFGLDWSRPPRQMNGTSFFYFNTGQWRYEKLQVDELLSSPVETTSERDGLLQSGLSGTESVQGPVRLQCHGGHQLIGRLAA